ncbi:MAG: phage tail protein [Burkholderiaceae bacterium]|nr:phage tail protein [Burkholderiaceae bacterium]
MDRINTASKAVDLFGAGKHGWKNRNVATGVEPTDFNAEWCNAQQEEKMSVIEGAGVVPAAGVFTQLRQALKRMFGGNVTTVNFAASPFALNADHAGLVLVDAAAGNVVINLPAVNVIAAKLEFSFVRSDASANTVTVNRAGADSFVGGTTSFTLTGQGDYRTIAGDATSKWAGTSFQDVKPGTIFAYAGTTAPAGSMICPIAATNVSRATYSALFAAIGTTWGAGDGVTTFGIPFFPADYTLLQANANVSTSSVGAVIAHAHSSSALPEVNSRPIGGGILEAATGGSTTGTTGAAANFAAGKRVLICVQY